MNDRFAWKLRIGALFLVGALGVQGALFADLRIYVPLPPPPPRVEVVGVAPSPAHVWIGGYHRWDGHAYVWVPGHWAARPHAHAVWTAGRWHHHARGYYWVEGHWH
jgi:hypothetical protein